MENYDKSLIKTVHWEKMGKYTIQAGITRFGDLAVFVYDENVICIWQGDNILKARAFIRTWRDMGEGRG